MPPTDDFTPIDSSDVAGGAVLTALPLSESQPARGRCGLICGSAACAAMPTPCGSAARPLHTSTSPTSLKASE